MWNHPPHRRGVLGVLLLLVLVAGWALAQGDDLYRLPSASTRVFQSSTLALTAGGRTVVTANFLSDTVSIVDPLQGAVTAEVSVGKQPFSVAITPDDRRALVVNRIDGTLSIVRLSDAQVQATYPLGVLPFAVVTDSNDEAWVSLQGSDEIIQIDLDTGEITQRIPVLDSPAGMALWGDYLYVTHFWSGDVSMIFLPQQRVVSTLSTGLQTGLSPSIALDPANALAYVPQSRLNVISLDLTFDNTVTPLVNVIDLRSFRLLPQRRYALDILDRPVNMPFAAVRHPTLNLLYVANAGSNSISVLDLDSGYAVGHIPVDANPRGILLNRDNSFIYAHSAVDGTLLVIDPRRYNVVDEIVVSDLQVPVNILIGAQLFYGADDSRLSTNNYISCASCHFDGLPDGRTWFGYPGGARNTPPLYDLAQTAPYSNAEWDQLTDLDAHIRAVQTGTGLLQSAVSPAEDTANLSPDLDALAAYLVTLTAPPNPTQLDADQVARGEALFNALECATCHSGDYYTDGLLYDVGTGGEVETPTLRWLWLSAPYLHDGSAPTLRDVFILEGTHRLIVDYSYEEIDALVAYLLSLP